jgi:uncharacterized protein (DUF305 family)
MRTTTKQVAVGAAMVLALSGIGAGVAVAVPGGHGPGGHGPGGHGAGHAAASGMGSTVDVHFATAMIPHHEDAVAMAELAPGRSQDPELLSLAERIARTQSEEIVLLQAAADRLAGDAGTGPGHGPMGMGMGMGMGGMGPGGDVDLSDLSGDAFDRALLEQMIMHHRMGVHMAAMEVRAGSDPEVRELAQGMVEVHSDEITLMQGWLEDRFGA